MCLDKNEINKLQLVNDIYPKMLNCILKLCRILKKYFNAPD